MSKQTISATIDDDLLLRLDTIAQDYERKRSWLISKAIEFYLDELEDLEIAKERLDDERLTTSQLRKKIGL